MTFRVLLYDQDPDHSQAAGTVEFDRLLVWEESDYRCLPRDILSRDEVVQLSAMLRQLPAQGRGRIGKYQWLEVQDWS